MKNENRKKKTHIDNTLTFESGSNNNISWQQCHRCHRNRRKNIGESNLKEKKNGGEKWTKSQHVKRRVQAKELNENIVLIIIIATTTTIKFNRKRSAYSNNKNGDQLLIHLCTWNFLYRAHYCSNSRNTTTITAAAATTATKIFT